MNKELEILSQGMAALQEKLGIVETEMFISIINREKIDYTSWRKGLWKDKSLDEIYNAASEFIKNNE